MRFLPVGLLAAGLVLGLVLPLTGSGHLPVVLGALCLAAAGIAAAAILAPRPAAGAGLVVAGIAAAVALLLLPGFVDGQRNGQGIAWAVPKGERVELAEAGIAVTSRDEGATITGRDLRTGARRWRRTFAKGDLSSQLEVRRVGATLLLVDRGGGLHAVDAGTGRDRWSAAARGAAIPVLATPDMVAVTRCGPTGGCAVEARALRDGTVRWRAPVDAAAAFLGAPTATDQPVSHAGLWPARYAVVQPRSPSERYTVRALDSGRVVAHGTTKTEAVGVVGPLLLRAPDRGGLTATDLSTGRVVWTRRPDGLTPARTQTGLLRWIGMPDGSVVLVSRAETLPELAAYTLRLLDPRSGRVRERELELRSGTAEIAATDGPPVTSATAARGPVPGDPVVRVFGDDQAVLLGARRYAVHTSPHGVVATATQAGWATYLHRFAGSEHNAAEVRDRRTGRRLVRRVSAGGPVYVKALGERLVISDDDREYVVAPS